MRSLSNWHRDAGAWLRAHRVELWILVAIWALLSVVMFQLASGHISPRRHQDEFLFWGLARSFASGDGLTWRGEGLGLLSWLYPVLLAPAFWLADGVPGQYTLVHLINALMISVTIFPAFLMARLMMGARRALVAGLLAVSVPAMNYAGIIGTENLAYPLFTGACGAMLLALSRPRPRNALLAFALLGACVLTRTQFLILLPIFAGTLLLAALMRPAGARGDYLSERGVIWIPLAVISALGGTYVLVYGASAFGLYAGAFDGVPLDLDEAWFWFKAFSADVYLLGAIVPAIATLAMLARAENRRDPVIGALLALALVASLALVLQVSWFSATNPYNWRREHIFYERYLFYLGPLYFTGLLAALGRVSWPGALASTLVATLVVSGFQKDAVLAPFSYDSFGLTLVGKYLAAHPAAGAQIGIALAAITLVVGLAYVVSTLRGRIAWATARILIGLVIAVLLVTQAQSWKLVRESSEISFDNFTKPVDFMARATSRPVGMIVTSEDAPLDYFTTEFWNPNVVRLFATGSAPFRTPTMYSPRCTLEVAGDGRMLSPDCDLIPSAWYMHGERLAMHLKDEYLREHPSPDAPEMTLMAGRPPARIFSLVDGRQVTSGVVQGQMTIRLFADVAGKLKLRLRAADKPVLVLIGKDSWPIEPGGRRTVTRDLPPGGSSVTMDVELPDGTPGGLVVDGVEVREGQGLWRTIL